MFEAIQNGFGAQGLDYGQREVEDMAKALTAGYGYAGAPGSLTSGSVLMVESLEYTLHSVTWDDRHLRIWPVIAKSDVWNTVHEFNRYTAHGQQFASGGFFDADAQVVPQAVDAQFNRQVARVRYLGCTKVVTHPMTLVKTSVESAVAIEARAGTKWILEQMERQLFESHDMFMNPATGLFRGLDADIPATSLKYDGIGKQITQGDNDVTAQYAGFDGYGGNISSIYDMQGAVPDEEDLEGITHIEVENFGTPTHFFMDFKFHSDLNRQFQPKERITPMGVVNGQAGFVLTQFYSSAGVYNMVGTRFLSPKGIPLTAQAGAPVAPTVVGAASGVANGSRLANGNYDYRVSACNNVGESAASAAGGCIVASTAGQDNLLTITAGLGDASSTHYAIYRSPLNAVTGHQFIGYVWATAGVGIGAATRDHGFKNPGLASAFMLSMDQAEVEWKQLAPLMKMNLAVLSPAIRFMVLLYGMPIVYAPKHHAIMRNIGKTA